MSNMELTRSTMDCICGSSDECSSILPEGFVLVSMPTAAICEEHRFPVLTVIHVLLVKRVIDV